MPQKSNRRTLAGTDAHTAGLETLPSMTVLLKEAATSGLIKCYGDGAVKMAIRQALDESRSALLAGKGTVVPAVPQLIERAEQTLSRLCDTDKARAVNATGILLHTGLGRAPLCDDALRRLSSFDHYSPLQVDLASGKRSLREERIERILQELTGCEAATVVNNNAAATMLVLNTLANGKEAVISRGQLIEIGGEFRIPDVMARSGTIMREVGTTNRTHLRDYESIIADVTGVIVHVHTSNYTIKGFTGTPSIRELCEMRRKVNPVLPVLDDIGSGALVSLLEFGLPDEPLVKESLVAGADLVCFSGDKLIGGPQSGIICGKRQLIEKIRKNPFARMFRICKMTVSALEATLLHFLNGTYRSAIPLYRMLSVDIVTLEAEAKRVMKEVGPFAGMSMEIVDELSYVGSGSAPDQGIPSKVLRVSGIDGKRDPTKTAATLRSSSPPILCRVAKDALLFDMRTLLPGDAELLTAALRKIL